MSKFLDGDGREWNLRLTVGDVADVKRETGVNLALVSKDAGWVDAVFSDPPKLVEILWVLCDEQAEQRGIAPERFGHLFDGAVLESAGVALAEAVADFFPRSAVAQAIRRQLPGLLARADAKAIAALEAEAARTLTD